MFLKRTKNNIGLLLKKELVYYFNNPFGYIAGALFAVFSHFMFVKDLFLIGDGGMSQFFAVVVWLLLIFVPVIGMRIFSEEKKSNTIEVLYSLPITKAEIIISKFLSVFLFCSLGLLLTIIIPIVLLFISRPHIPTIIVSYMGLLFLIGLFASITTFFSSVTESQIVAFLFSLLTLFFLTVLGSDFFSNVASLELQSILVFFSPLSHLSSFFKGVIELRAVVFFVTGTVLFLYITYFSLSNKKK